MTAESFAEINRYLDETDNAEDAVPFGDLAQAAEEAKLELKRRGVPEDKAWPRGVCPRASDNAPVSNE